MEQNKEFVSGLYINAPNVEFIVCKIGIVVPQLLEYLQNSNEEKINLDVKQNRDGKYYAEINTWKADQDNNQNNNQNNNQGYQNNNQGNNNQGYQNNNNRNWNNR